MVERTLQGSGGGLPSMLRAALPALPVVGGLPGIKRSGSSLPDLTVRRERIAIDPEHVRAYAVVCGFAPSQALPLTYPHLLCFGAELSIMTDGSFPFPAIGTVHLANHIHQLRPIAPLEPLDLVVRPTGLRPHPKGRVFDLCSSISVDAELVWESTSTYLRLGHGDAEAPAAGLGLDPVPSNGVIWRLPGNLGRRYAAVSGDHNPIHLYPFAARALGFKRQIVHGMWSKARCVAAIASRLPDEATVSVEFKKPIFLPASVAFGSQVTSEGLDFSLTSPQSAGASRGPVPHLVGRAGTYPPPSPA